MKRYDRRDFLKTTGLLAAGALAPWRARAAESGKKLNVLFIAVDDLRPELGCYDHKWIKSPNIDKLAASGTVFNRAYCQVAVCGASRASLLTGLRPTPKRFLSSQTRADKDAPGAMTIPEEFRKNGYHCISNGKIFHHRDDTEKRSWSERAWRPKTGGMVCLDPESKKMIGGKKKRGPWFEGPDVPDNAYGDGQTADKTISDLKAMKKSGKPFFMACGFYKPHLPFYAPKKYWDMYDRDKIALAENRRRPKNAPKMLRGSGEIRSYHNRNLKYNSDAWHAAGRHGYYACVSYIDAQVGKVLGALDKLGLRESTIVILWGDHGWHLGEHNFWGKHNVMHLATNSPMIVSAPGFKGGQKSERLTEFVDIYPSLCELAGVKPANKGLQGTSFAPLLKNPARPWKKAAFSKFGPAISLITDRLNYAEFKNGD
jgi:iduronate 2-sulfatase